MSLVFGVFFKTQNSELPNSELAFLIGQGFRFGFQLLLGTKGVDDDGCFSIDRTFVFADAAARAFLFFHNRAFLVVTHDSVIGTLLIADEAYFFRIPRNATRLVDMGDSHLNKPLLINGKSSNCLRGADSSAEITEFLTVTDPGNKPRGVETRQTCL